MIECTHCLPRLLDLRSHNVVVRRGKLVRNAWIAAACTLCLIAGFTVSRVLIKNTPPIPQQSALPTLTLDLTNHGTYRGSQQDNQPSLVLPASRFALQLILPRFSETGQYSLSISKDRQSRSLVCVGAVAKAKGEQTLLSTSLDLSALPSGNYVFVTEHEGDGGAYYYPVSIH